MLTQFTLSNGLKCAAYKYPSAHSVSVHLAVKGGACFDHPQKMGTAHLLEHMLLQGTPTWPSAESITEFVESRAGYINAFTHFMMVELVLKLPERYLKEALHLASEIFFQPKFPEEALEKEKQIMLEELYSNYLTTHDRVGRFFLEAKYNDGSLARNEVGGLPDMVKTLNMEDLKSLYQLLFKTDNTFLFIVGNFDEATLPVLVESYFGGAKSEGNFIGVPKFTDQDFHPEAFHYRQDTDLKSVYADLSFKGMPQEASVREFMAQMAAINILVNLHGSRLYNELRYKRGLVYAISLSTVTMQGFGLNNIPFECSENHLVEIMDIVVDNLIRIKRDGITEAEYAYIQNFGVDKLMMQFDGMGAIMDTIKEDSLWEDKIYLPEECIEIIRSIKLEEVNSLIAKYWDFSKANLCLQMGAELSGDLKKSLESSLNRLKNS